ncbi:hypothetical protein ACYIU4_002826 [Clostridium botulinum]
MKGKTSVNVNSINEVMAEVSNNFNTDISILDESFEHVAPVAGSAKDILLALGLMSNVGIKGSQSEIVLINLAKTSNWKDELRQKFSGLSNDQKIKYAASIFGKEAMSGALSIINAL